MGFPILSFGLRSRLLPAGFIARSPVSIGVAVSDGRRGGRTLVITARRYTSCIRTPRRVSETDSLEAERFEDMRNNRAHAVGDHQSSSSHYNNSRRVGCTAPLPVAISAQIWLQSGGWSADNRHQEGPHAGAAVQYEALLDAMRFSLRVRIYHWDAGIIHL